MKDLDEVLAFAPGFIHESHFPHVAARIISQTLPDGSVRQSLGEDYCQLCKCPADCNEIKEPCKGTNASRFVKRI